MNINRDNYESFFLLYLDQELKQQDKLAVDKFLVENPDLQKEFSQLQQAICIPEQIEYEQKELLFHKEEKRRVLPLYWVRIAASIAVIITTGWFIIIGISKNHTAKLNAQPPLTARSQVKKEQISKPDDSGQMGLNNNSKNLTEVNNKPDHSNARKLHAQGKQFNKKENISIADKQEMAESPDAIQKSSTALEIQNNNDVVTDESKKVALVASVPASSGILISNAAKDEVQGQRADATETAYRTDNSVNVIALDDNNKSINGFFKKLARANPENNKTTNTRKIQVSVFQFSY